MTNRPGFHGGSDVSRADSVENAAQSALARSLRQETVIPNSDTSHEHRRWIPKNGKRDATRWAAAPATNLLRLRPLIRGKRLSSDVWPYTFDLSLHRLGSGKTVGCRAASTCRGAPKGADTVGKEQMQPNVIGRSVRMFGAVALLGGLCASVASVGTAGASSPVCSADTCTVTLAVTGVPQAFTVPAGVTTIQVTVDGAQGGSTGSPTQSGGLGGTVSATLSVNPGSVLSVDVGGRGTDGDNFPPDPVAGGYGGGGIGAAGGSSQASGAGGGGGSFIFGPTGAILVAAGGGGGTAGSNTWTVLGGKSGEAGTDGESDTSGEGGKGGTGASVGAPGAGGAAAPGFGVNGANGTGPASEGSFGSGDNGGTGESLTFGGGGGGGNGSAGGGGSSFSVDPSATFTTGSWSGDGEVHISYPSSPAPPAASSGYWLLGGDGGVFTFGGIGFFGSAASNATSCPANPPARSMPNGSCWSIAPTADDGGYWILNAYNGKIYTYGDAVSYGQPADTVAYSGGADTWPTGMSIVSTPDGKGYWVLEVGLSGLGSVQTFGDAVSYGDEVTVAHGTGHVGQPVGLATTPDGKGYWIVDSDGGVFSFGDAVFHGSTGGQHLNAPVAAMASTADGSGYWLAAADGGVFAFGDAAFGGSMAAVRLHAPVVDMTPDRAGAGYWLAAADGGVFALGGAPFLGSMGGSHLSQPVFAIASLSPVRFSGPSDR